MQKDSDQSCLLKKCKYRPTISYQNSFSKRSTHQSITCWFWYLLFLFIFFVDLFKPLLQKTFVEGIVENPLRDQSWSFSSPWLKESKARKGIWTQGNLVAPRCISQNWPEALQLTFDLSTFGALWSTDSKKADSKITYFLSHWYKVTIPFWRLTLIVWTSVTLFMQNTFRVNCYQGENHLEPTVTKSSILDVIVHCPHQICCRFFTHWIETKVNFDCSPSPCHTIISMSLVRINLKSWILLNIQFWELAKRYLCTRQQIQIGLFPDFCDVSAN